MYTVAQAQKSGLKQRKIKKKRDIRRERERGVNLLPTILIEDGGGGEDGRWGGGSGEGMGIAGGRGGGGGGWILCGI